MLILRHQLEIGGDHGAQEIAKGHVHWRQVVKGTDAHVQHALRGARGLAGDAVDQVGVQVALRQRAGATGGDAHQVADAPLVGLEEAVEDRRHQHRPALVGLDHRVAEAPARLVQGRAQRLAGAGGMAKLLCQLHQGGR